jgi:predicted dehydrogenase
LSVKSIGVVGGGRWARVTITVLCGLLKPGTRVLVASPRNAEGMRLWLSQNELRNHVEVLESWRQLAEARPNAAIVVNAARDHEPAATMLLSASVPVLIEKPIALSARGAEALIALAARQRVLLASALVFRYAPYVHDFAALVADAAPGDLTFEWADPIVEQRYQELKRYDSSLPVLVDVLPHVVAILEAAGFGSGLHGLQPGVDRGGAAVTLTGQVGNHSCTICLAREADRRRRRIALQRPDQEFSLDFTEEPACLMHNGTVLNESVSPPASPSPLADMLASFLEAVEGEKTDERLDVGCALECCRILDKILPRYQDEQLAWLRSRAIAREDAGVRYAVREMVTTQLPKIAFTTRLEQLALQRLIEWKHSPQGAPFSEEWLKAAQSDANC